jgi:hypothetical protein
MDLQAKRISGSTFSAEDKLEVIFSSDNQPMASVVHTIELVSGVNVTHGGGGQPDEYLHYKATERDADSNGIIDYSNVEMALVQDTQGTSVVKVTAQVLTKGEADAFNTEFKAWNERKEVAESLDEEFTEESPTFEPTILTTGEITLEWSDDNFV